MPEPGSHKYDIKRTRLRDRTAVASRNSYGHAQRDGPEPPVGAGAHRYFFRRCATDRPLDLEPESTADDLRQALEGATLAHGTPVGRYER